MKWNERSHPTMKEYTLWIDDENLLHTLRRYNPVYEGVSRRRWKWRWFALSSHHVEWLPLCDLLSMFASIPSLWRSKWEFARNWTWFEEEWLAPGLDRYSKSDSEKGNEYIGRSEYRNHNLIPLDHSNNDTMDEIRDTTLIKILVELTSVQSGECGFSPQSKSVARHRLLQIKNQLIMLDSSYGRISRSELKQLHNALFERWWIPSPGTVAS